MVGGFGADVLNGGEGADVLRGERGADVFGFSVLESDATDRVADLRVNDWIDVSEIDAVAATAEDDAFVLVDNFSETAGEMRLIQGANAARLLLDVDGDGKADMTVELRGQHDGFDNFVL